MAEEHLVVEMDGTRLRAPEELEQTTARSQTCSEFFEVDLERLV
jgi:hypothetical protein